MSLSTLSKGLPSFLTRKGAVSDSPVFRVFKGSGDSENGLEKWQIALLVGSPIVFGAAFYYYYFHVRNTNDDIGKSKETKNGIGKRGTIAQIKVPDDPYDRAVYYKNQGNNLFCKGNYEAALEVYSKAIECCPSDKYETLAIFHQNKAAAYEATKNFEKVIEECTNALRHNKTYVKALQRRAKAYESLGKIKDALNDITVVDILEKFLNKEGLLMTDRLLRQQSKKKASEFVKNKKFRLPSKHYLKTYFGSFRRDPLVKEEKASEEGLAKLLSSLENQPDKTDSHIAEISLIKGTQNFLMGDIESAYNELSKVSKMDNVGKDLRVNSLIKLGLMAVQKNPSTGDELKETLNYFEKAIEIDPSNQDIYIHRAQIYILDEKAEEALRDLEKCCELDSNFESALAQKLYVKFRCAVRTQDISTMNEVKKMFKEAMNKFPKSTEVYSLYAQTLMEQSEFAEAEKLFNKALECDRKDANIYVHRGILEMQSKFNFEKAAFFMEEALRVDDQCQFAYEMLGTINVQLGNLKKGIECFEKALEVSSSEVDCAHLFSLRDAAEAQIYATELLNSPTMSK